MELNIEQPLKKEQLRIGDVLRCCAESWYSAMEKRDFNAKDGDIIDCKWCKESLIFDRDAWRWYQEKNGSSAYKSLASL